MKKMYPIAFLFFAVILLTSCSINRSIMVAPSASLNKPNFRIVKTVTGSAETEHFLAFGGLNTNGLTNEAKANLYQNANLKDNQTIGNITLDSKITLLFFYLYWKEQVYISADVIEFFSENNKNLNNRTDEIQASDYRNKPDAAKITIKDSIVKDIPEGSILELINSKNYLESKYLSSYDINLNDIVRYTTSFSEFIYGQVIDKTNPKKIKLKYFSPSHNALIMEVSWRELHIITPYTRIK